MTRKRILFLAASLAMWVAIMLSPMCGCGADPERPDMRKVYETQRPDLAPASDCLPCSWTETVNCVPSVCVYQGGRLCCLRNS